MASGRENKEKESNQISPLEERMVLTKQIYRQKMRTSTLVEVPEDNAS